MKVRGNPDLASKEAIAIGLWELRSSIRNLYAVCPAEHLNQGASAKTSA